MPNQQIQDDAQELIALRTAHTEVLAKAHERKTLNEALKAELAEVKQELAAAKQDMLNVTIRQPLAKRAAAISPIPSLFLEQLEKSYAVHVDADGKLILSCKQDGKPVLDTAGNPVNVLEGNTLWHVLTGGQQGAKTEEQKMFAALLRYQGASGGGGGISSPRSWGGSSTQPEEPAAGVKRKYISACARDMLEFLCAGLVGSSHRPCASPFLRSREAQSRQLP